MPAQCQLNTVFCNTSAATMIYAIPESKGQRTPRRIEEPRFQILRGTCHVNLSLFLAMDSEDVVREVGVNLREISTFWSISTRTHPEFAARERVIGSVGHTSKTKESSSSAANFLTWERYQRCSRPRILTHRQLYSPAKFIVTRVNALSSTWSLPRAFHHHVFLHLSSVRHASSFKLHVLSIYRSFVLTFLTTFAGWSAAASAVLVSPNGNPTATLDNGTFMGRNNGSVNRFLGIPYALPPVGNLRFKLPRPNDPYTGIRDAGKFGVACIQQNTTMVEIPPNLPLFVQKALRIFLSQNAPVANQSEDCLTLDVITPNAYPPSSLPVLVWFYGGDGVFLSCGFEDGWTLSLDGGVIVQRSIELNNTVIYVAINYRVTALGFLDGREVRKAGIGNIGLQDLFQINTERQGLRWIQKYISSFGGDPTKVTIWGESSGGMSVTLQMLTNGGDTEGLFRGAFMQSGGPIPRAGTIDTGALARLFLPKAQGYFDMLVNNTDCALAADKLHCLRQVPIGKLSAAINKSPSINSYQVGFTCPYAVADTKMATLGVDGGVGSAQRRTDEEVHDYMSSNYLPFANSSSIDELLRLYPQDPTQGSPFDTGTNNSITAQFKRLAALQGDVVFQAPRRFFLQQRSGLQKTWSFLSKRLKTTPVVGSYHGSDLQDNVYAPGDMTDYLVRFATSLDPNGATGIHWPQYTNTSPQLLTFLDGNESLAITDDTYRQEALQFVIDLSVSAPS
ncbi:Alpha/Beta hydrolase protein [Amylostereum chailletii]|nr:Alpha/Beta hydrolase protein [Amylostereum chailletii]